MKYSKKEIAVLLLQSAVGATMIYGFILIAFMFGPQ